MKRGQNAIKCKLTAALLATTIAISGCGSASSASDSTMSATGNSFLAEDSGYYSENEAAAEESQVTENSSSVQTNRKLIKTVNMTVETEEFNSLIDNLNQKIESLGGYAQYFSTQGSEGERYSSMTIRIPKDKLDTFLETLEGVSNITYRQENIEDVTLDYVDVEGRKKMLEKEQQRFLELLEQAQSLEDILTIESRLTDVQYELESKESQLRTYDNQIDYSTVYLDINEVARYTPQEQKGVWAQISTGFMENLYQVGIGLRNFLIAVIIHIPNIVVFLVFVAIIALIVKFIIRQEQKHSIKTQNRRMQQQEAQQRTVQQSNFQPAQQGNYSNMQQQPPQQERKEDGGK